jgi:hypothetical protein
VRYGNLMHYREAAKWAGIPWATFETLEPEEQGMTIAQYECMTRLEALEIEHQRRESEAARQRAAAKARR